ncbi:MAG: CDP-alcohol phosphatidyltransferase family protein [Spirochaetes bacterium]|nr:CDP-alcohol phosphatidyltransferase family protein [Spirochaetota bacterium]
MLSELKTIKSLQKMPDGIFGSFMTRPVSHIVAYISYKLKLSPNFVSFLSFIFCTISIVLLIVLEHYCGKLAAAGAWWLAAILDAADGDLARFTKKASPFGGWFDSLLDRIKEFMIFSALGYIAFKEYNNEVYLALGILSVFSTVMSGWVSDTKKLFIQKRTVEVSLTKKYSLGMVDTRDFVVIVSLLLSEIRIALISYSTIFVFVLLYQILKFYYRFGINKNNAIKYNNRLDDNDNV